MAPQRLRAGPQRLVRIALLRLLPLSSRSLTSFASFLLPNTKSKAQTTKKQLFHPSPGFGYSVFLRNSYLTLQTPRRGTLVLFSVSLQTTTPFPDHYVCFKVKSKRQDSHKCLINVYKGSLPQCPEPLCPKLVNCLGLHLWKNHHDHHPAKRAHLGHVCQTSVKQELSDEEKQLFQAQHARGPTYKLGTSKPGHLQLQVMSTTAGSVLHF